MGERKSESESDFPQNLHHMMARCDREKETSVNGT